MQLSGSKRIGPKLLCALTGGVLQIANAAHGAVVYGNFNATDVNYLNVTETPTQLPGPTPVELFGAPAVSGDSLLFTPSNFSVGVSGGSNEFQDGHLSFDIATTDSSYPKIISLTEGGGWAVGGGTTATTAMESLIINQLFITSVNGVSVNPIVVTPTITFTDTNNGSASVVKTSDSIEFESSAGFSTGSWNASASFNLSAALAADGMTGSVTGLSMNLDNQLAVTSETNSDAFIDKKFFDVTTGSTPVPEPATAGLIGMVVAAASMRRRRSSGK
jgi:hypothetical protein